VKVRDKIGIVTRGMTMIKILKRILNLISKKISSKDKIQILGSIGDETFRLCQQYLDDMVLVDSDEVCAAMKDLFEKYLQEQEKSRTRGKKIIKTWQEKLEDEKEQRQSKGIER